MVEKLNYAIPSRSTRRTTRDFLIDALAGSGLVVSGLFATIFLSFFDRALGSEADQWFEKPRHRVRRGIVRIGRGREAANRYRP